MVWRGGGNPCGRSLGDYVARVLTLEFANTIKLSEFTCFSGEQRTKVKEALQPVEKISC